MEARTKWAGGIAAAAALLVSGAAWLGRAQRPVAKNTVGAAQSERPALAAEGPQALQAPADAESADVRAPRSSQPASDGNRDAAPASTRSPLVVRGTIVDEQGQPVSDARVEIYRDATAGQWYSGNKLDDDLYTDELGRFELLEKLAAASIGVHVTADGFVPREPEVVPLGTDDLRLVLVRGGWLGGRMLFTGAIQPTLELLRDGEVVLASRTSSGSDEPSEPGRFVLGPLPPGTYVLACGYPWSTERAWVDGLRVFAGEVNRDPRLDPLDIRGALPTVALTIVDRDGRSIIFPAISLPRAGTEEFVHVESQREGERWLIEAGPLPLRIRIEAAGFRSQELLGVDSDRRVVLERGLRVRLEIIGALPEVPEGWELRGELTRQNPGHAQAGAAKRAPRAREPGLLFRGEVAEAYLAEPGKYLFSFQVQPGGPFEAHASFWDEPQPVLDVRDDGTVQRFELRAPSSATVKEMRAFIAKAPARRPVFPR